MQLITVCQLQQERNSNALRNSQGGSVRIPGQALALPFYFWAKLSNTKHHFTTLSKGGAYKLNKKENALMRELNGKYSVGNLTSGDQFAFLTYLANNWKALVYKGTIKNIHQIPMSLSYICRLKKKRGPNFQVSHACRINIHFISVSGSEKCP